MIFESSRRNSFTVEPDPHLSRNNSRTALPLCLRSAVLACELVEATLEWFSEEEILLVESENMVVLDGIKHPIRKGDLNVEHSAFAGFPNDLGGLDQTKDLEVLLTALANVRLDFECPEAF